jgi:hypothetical protein
MARNMFQRMTVLLLAFLAKIGLREKVERVAHGETAMVDTGTHFAPAALPSRLAADSRGQLGLQTVLAAVTVVIAVSLSIIVVDKFDQQLGEPSSSALSTAQNDVLSGFGSMTSLIGPLFLVGISAVIIGVIRRVA